MTLETTRESNRTCRRHRRMVSRRTTRIARNCANFFRHRRRPCRRRRQCEAGKIRVESPVRRGAFGGSCAGHHPDGDFILDHDVAACRARQRCMPRSRSEVLRRRRATLSRASSDRPNPAVRHTSAGARLSACRRSAKRGPLISGNRRDDPAETTHLKRRSASGAGSSSAGPAKAAQTVSTRRVSRRERGPLLQKAHRPRRAAGGFDAATRFSDRRLRAVRRNRRAPATRRAASGPRPRG